MCDANGVRCYAGRVLRVRNVTFMTVDHERLADFWPAALGLGERRASSAEIVLADADWGFPRFTFQPISEGRRQASAVHVDVTADHRLAEVVARLVALGATTRSVGP